VKFELNPREKESAKEFIKQVKKKVNDIDISYHFYPTAIGIKVIIRSGTYKIEKDITDYGSWKRIRNKHNTRYI